MIDQALAVSRYAMQLDRFREALGAPQILAFNGEKPTADFTSVLRRCAELLAIEPGHSWPAVRRAEEAPSSRLSDAAKMEIGRARRDDMPQPRDEEGVVARWGFADAIYRTTKVV